MAKVKTYNENRDFDTSFDISFLDAQHQRDFHFILQVAYLKAGTRHYILTTNRTTQIGNLAIQYLAFKGDKEEVDFLIRSGLDKGYALIGYSQGKHDELYAQALQKSNSEIQEKQPIQLSEEEQIKQILLNEQREKQNMLREQERKHALLREEEEMFKSVVDGLKELALSSDENSIRENIEEELYCIEHFDAAIKDLNNHSTQKDKKAVSILDKFKNELSSPSINSSDNLVADALLELSISNKIETQQNFSSSATSSSYHADKIRNEKLSPKAGNRSMEK